MYDFDTNARIVFATNSSEIDDQDRICENCGMSLFDIKREGIVGCVNCYKIFSREIRQMIINSQGTINHVGVIPSKHFSKVKIKEKIAELEKQKESAIAEENYVSAESIKNQIEKLKGEL